MTSRPTSATVIGWLFIGLSALMVFSSAMSGIMWALFPDDFSREAPLPERAPWAWRVMFSAFEYFEALVILQFLLALAGIAAGTALLRTRPWGRVLAEVLTWLGLLYMVVFGIIWLLGVGSMLGGETAPTEMRWFGVMMFAMGSVLFLAFSIPFVVVLVALRGNTIRTWIQGARVDDA